VVVSSEAIAATLDAELRAMVALRLPPGIESAACDGRTEALALAEEVALTRDMIPKRRSEFLSGRSCARKLLRRLGVADQPLLVGRNRAPQWPEGIVGSISHTGGACVAVVGRALSVRAIGVDVERTGAVRRELERRIATPEERSAYAARDDDWRTLLFSAKEAVYKAVRPATGLRPRFEDVRVDLSVPGELAAEVSVPGTPPVAVRGCWFRAAGFVVAVAHL